MGADDETRAMLRGVLGRLAPAATDAAASGLPTERRQPKAAAAAGSEQAGFDGAGTGTAPAAAVQNLGVVGRGTKRIKLQPVAVSGGRGKGRARRCRADGHLLVAI